MRKVKVRASSSYEIIIGESLLDSLGEYARAAVGDCRFCIVTDERVDPLYSSRAADALARCGYESKKFVIGEGESSKNAQNLIALLEFMASEKFTRKDCVIALGGGVVGDLAGFAASIYLRGVRFIQIPTTLLAAVDSSVGGKTAIDIASGKNLVGSFHQPSLVLCDVRTLDTLPPEIFADGCAEVVKYAIINDREMFGRLEEGGIKKDIERVIADCVAHKADIVARDEFDRGERQLLNLGHTVGHAIEACSAYSVSHGSAVAIGTSILIRASAALGLCPESDAERVLALFSSLGLPTRSAFSASELAAAASTDKKRAGESLNLVMPYAIGDTRILTVELGELASYIEKGL